MSVSVENVAALAALMTEWHEAEFGIAPGYLGSRLLADRDHDGRYLLVVEFSSPEAAEQNNDRPETQQWAERMNALIDGPPEFGNYDEAHSVG
jgi:quinol monooxygenase YgiN